MPSPITTASSERYQLGYLFAERAAQIPLPEEDILFVRADVYAWRATDEQAVCASWIGKHAEAFTLCRRLLARPDIPDDRPATDCGQPRLFGAGDDRGGVVIPGCAGAAASSRVHATPRSPSAWSPGRIEPPPSRH